MTRYRGVVQSTGELIDVDAPAIRGRRRRSRRKVYAMVDLESLDQLELSAAEWRVLHRIMRAVNVETNEARVSIAELGRELDMAPSNVSRIMREFRDRRIVYTMRLGTHRVNPHIMFRGSNQDWDIATDTEPEPVWVR
jgi:DNA-binding transcriptional ArsR family regulator